jgi:hypothetical protein
VIRRSRLIFLDVTCMRLTSHEVLLKECDPVLQEVRSEGCGVDWLVVPFAAPRSLSPLARRLPACIHHATPSGADEVK